ncbi:MAG: hypothetical protein A2Y23_01845 [Clostridiales bacterium GWB2_37_7]|nr:MAG: hypothetical protein A2Y23_01845 [Clostridiales bacterium GWB2_37_7]
MVKVIYFDEGSATDFIHMINGGNLEETTENIKDKTIEIAGKATAEAKARFKWLPFIGASVGTEGAVEASSVKNTIIRKAISNTILTDYINKANNENDGKKIITTFNNCMITPYPDSFAYYKMLTPYLIMTEGNLDLEEGFSLNVARMDEALESGRGYYELIVTIDAERSVLRFNIKAFRNNYGIADLVKMKLTYHAIEVGVIPEESLTMQQEFSGKQKSITGFDIVNNSVQDTSFLKVYDVILAGVDK